MSTQQSADLPYRVGTARVGKENARGRARRGHPGCRRHRRLARRLGHFAALGFQLAADPGRARARGRGADRRAAREPSPGSLPGDALTPQPRASTRSTSCARTNTIFSRCCSAGRRHRDLLDAPGGAEGRRDAARARPYRAWPRLAADIDPDELSREFFDLFIGVGRGELLPYASYYLTGFLHERPLARVREDLNGLGHRARRRAPASRRITSPSFAR